MHNAKTLDYVNILHNYTYNSAVHKANLFGWLVGATHPIPAQAATIDGYPSVASNYSLGGQLHYSVPVKHGRGGDLFVPLKAIE